MNNDPLIQGESQPVQTSKVMIDAASRLNEEFPLIKLPVFILHGTEDKATNLCVTCGHVGCCDDSKNKHAAKHFHLTNHPLIKSFEADEEWGWCYVDELLLESVPGSLTTEWCGVLGATP